ncbi:histidine-containing phosphotransfer protein 5-like [Cryptomeria japonica]|uniref:histidine-containing phosphotransfer protein 5-like n=1 Tax=Cryptomeria japonica TaxID=3369 RepID=UPI0025AD78A1|nr:histidine-containing phosphotransfer protein 5-like [Cryptomeria japonica]
MATVELQQQYNNVINSLYEEVEIFGFVDEQFSELMENEGNPGFVRECLSSISDDIRTALNGIRTTLNNEPVDDGKLDRCLFGLYYSSSRMGAKRVKNIYVTFCGFCVEKKRDECLQCLQQVKQEFNLFKDKVEELLQIENQILLAGGTISTRYRHKLHRGKRSSSSSMKEELQFDMQL